jgi:hypothetical protein
MPDIDDVLDATERAIAQEAGTASRGAALEEAIDSLPPAPSHSYERSVGGLDIQGGAAQPAAPESVTPRTVEAPVPPPAVTQGDGGAAAPDEKFDLERFLANERAAMEADRNQALSRAAQVEAELANERAWRQQAEPVLNDVTSMWPEIRTKWQEAEHLKREKANLERKVGTYREVVNKAKEQYGLDFDEQAWEAQQRMSAALERLENIDQILDNALSAREQRAAEARRSEEMRRVNSELDTRFEREYAALVKDTPQLATPEWKLAVKVNWAQDVTKPVAEAAKPYAASFKGAQVAHEQRRQDQARSMPVTQHGGGGVPHSVQQGSNPYEGKGLEDIFRMRRSTPAGLPR